LFCILLLSRLQPQAAAQSALSWPHQIKTLIFQCSLCRLGIELARIFEPVLAQRNVSETRPCSGAKTACLSEFGYSGEAAARGLERVLKMLLCRVEIVIEVADASHSQFVTRIDYCCPILIEFFLGFECSNHRTGRCFDGNPAR